MARRATIVGHVTDVWGDDWDVREMRPTDHGFPVCFGWPKGIARGRSGSGGPKVIVTTPLAAHLEKHRLEPGKLALPIGNTAIKRLRRLMGHYHPIDRAAWWQERIGDLAEYTTEQFAETHGVSVGAIVMARQAFFGPRQRAAGWWRTPATVHILTSRQPTAEIAVELGLSVISVRRLRAEIRLRSPAIREYGRQYGRRRLRHISQGEKEKMAEMLVAGVSIMHISEHFERTASSIINLIKKGELPPSLHPAHGTKKALSEDDIAAAKRMILGGATLSEVGAKFGFSGAHIFQKYIKPGLLPHTARAHK